MIDLKWIPIFSVIVPVYNTRQYLSRCLDSILNQRFSDFELLLVDDGSTDGSDVICDEFAKKDNRVRVFHKANCGVSSARNVGLDNAIGEWVCFVDSDDELMSDGFNVMKDGFSDDVDMVMAGYEIQDDGGNVVYSIETRVEKRISSLMAISEMFSPADYRYQGYIWGKSFRMSVIRAGGLRFAEDVFYNEDRLFVAKFISSSQKDVFYTTKPVYRYSERADGAMMSLKKTFNNKFVTDMEAQARIRELVRLHYDNEILQELADYGIYHSYRMIVGIMHKSNAYNACLSHELRTRLIDIIGRGKYIQYESRRKIQKILKRLKHLSR